MGLGEKIREFRLKKGMTQQQLADAIGVKRAAVSKYEKAGVGVNTAKAMLSGKSVKPCTFGKICKALGVEVEELIEREV